MSSPSVKAQEQNKKNVEEKRVTQEIISWLNLTKYEQQYGFVVQEMDVSLACQYSGKQVVMPARSESCDISCLVEKDILEETMICSCGKQIDEENYYVEDWQLFRIMKFIRQRYGEQVKMIRVNLIDKKFWSI